LSSTVTGSGSTSVGVERKDLFVGSSGVGSAINYHAGRRMGGAIFNGIVQKMSPDLAEQHGIHPHVWERGDFPKDGPTGMIVKAGSNRVRKQGIVVDGG